MRVLSNLVEGTDNKPSSPAITKFVQDQFNQLLQSPKLHELVERISFSENIPKEETIKRVMEELTNQAKEKTKAKRKKFAANLELILR